MMMTSKKSAEGAHVRVATYTEKSFCVFGDTYPIRKMLKAAKLEWVAEYFDTMDEMASKQ